MQQRGKRHDGGVSRVCRFCGEVGARVVDIGGFVHRRCIGPAPKPKKNTPRPVSIGSRGRLHPMGTLRRVGPQAAGRFFFQPSN